MKKFGTKDQLSYMFGDIGGNFVNMFVDSYFLVFCTYVLNISPFFMGTLFLFARLFDAINDPIMGAFPDRFLIGKSGDRFKPYIKIFMWPLAVSGLLCFTNVSSFSDVFKYIWICAAYVMVDICYTGTSMPYGSLASVISPDSIDRTKLSRARGIGGLIVAMIMAVVPMFIWRNNADGTQDPIPEAFFIFAVIFGIGCIISYLVFLRGTTERIKSIQKEEGYKYSNVLKGVIKNRPLIGAIIANIGSLISLTGMTQFGTFVWKEYYNQPEFVTYVMAITIPITLILFPFIPRLTKRFSKRTLILVPSVLGLAVSFFLLFVPIMNPWIFFAFLIAAMFGNQVFIILVWAVVADCLDYQELITGERMDGSVYSIVGFARKLGSAITSTVASYALGWIGYNADVTTQTAEVANQIRTLYTSLPLITGAFLVVGLGLIFNLTKKDSERITNELSERRQV